MSSTNELGSGYTVKGLKRSKRLSAFEEWVDNSTPSSGSSGAVEAPISYIRDPEIKLAGPVFVVLKGPFRGFDRLCTTLGGIIGKFLLPVEVQRLSLASKSTKDIFHAARVVHFMHFREGDVVGTPMIEGDASAALYPFLRLRSDIYRLTCYGNVLPVDRRMYERLIGGGRLPEYVRCTHLWVNPELYKVVLSLVSEILLVRSGVGLSIGMIGEMLDRADAYFRSERATHGDVYHRWPGIVPCEFTYGMSMQARQLYYQRAADWWFRAVLEDLGHTSNGVLYGVQNYAAPNNCYAWVGRGGKFEYTEHFSEIREFINTRMLVIGHLSAKEPAFFGPHFALEADEDTETEVPDSEEY